MLLPQTQLSRSEKQKLRSSTVFGAKEKLRAKGLRIDEYAQRSNGVCGNIRTPLLLVCEVKMLTGIGSQATLGLCLVCLASMVEGGHQVAPSGISASLSKSLGQRQRPISLRLKGGGDEKDEHLVPEVPNMKPSPPKIEEVNGASVVTQAFVTNTVRDWPPKPMSVYRVGHGRNLASNISWRSHRNALSFLCTILRASGIMMFELIQKEYCGLKKEV
jgi:hypothetical protein